MTVFSCVVMGNESLAVECSKKLLARDHRIAAVVTENKAISDWAAENNLQVIDPSSDLADALSGIQFDWLFSIANLQIIPEAVLSKPAKGAINFHDGPLPRHAGLNAPVWALIEGEQEHGIAWHIIEPKVDTGAIVARGSFAIEVNDTALTLNTKAYEAGLSSFSDVIARLETGTPNAEQQDPAQRSYHARADRPFAAGLLDISKPAMELSRLCRAMDHGPYWNPLSTPKLWVQDQLVTFTSAKLIETHATAGTVIEVSPTHLAVACGDGGLELHGLESLDGAAFAPNNVLSVGDTLTLPNTDGIAAMEAASKATAKHDQWWRRRLAKMNAAKLELTTSSAGEVDTIAVSNANTAHVLAWAMQLAQTTSLDVAYTNADLATLAQSHVTMPWVPLHADSSGTVSDLKSRATSALVEAEKKVGFARDLFLRDPSLKQTLPDIAISDKVGALPGAALTVELSDTGAVIHYDTGRIHPMQAKILVARLDSLAKVPETTPLAELPTMSDMERQMVLFDWNETTVAATGPQTMQAMFEAQVAKTPNEPALVFEAETISYADLNARTNRVAHTLKSMAVGPDTVVGLFCNRSADMLIGALGILKAGGAYLPLDPAYPADRLAHYVADSGTPVILTQNALRGSLPENSASILEIDTDPRISQASSSNPDPASAPENLAYVIYTSGSTGLPKGVMIEHRNVANFFLGMDGVIANETAGTWLAVTSLSFDISVLELFWTTSRGFKVVLSSDENRNMISGGPIPLSDSKMDFSIYYWGNDDGVGRDKYRLLLEGAQFADKNGFCAVWTPERHFHAFGGPYPNPSVTGAAVAAVTRNIAVRAGSVVSPLHHPARIAEEWAVIDNLTNGRTGLALASGWQPDDFVLRPENTPPNNKTAMIENVEQLRKLWAGEPVAFPRKDGTLHEVVTQPRPMSKELPLWVTTAGNPDTWREAGRLGCNVLTHLLGQSLDEVADKIKLYHAELRKTGRDPKDYTVTLMLHTCLADSREEARERAREPMKDYLRSAAGLIKQYAWAFPAFKRPTGVSNAFELDLGILDESELEEILDFAFERYFNDSGMFGTIEDALARTEQLKRIGVGEVACLIDYGIATDEVLSGLHHLAQVVRSANADVELAEDDFSIAAQIIRHDVSHLQCTPSMARMICMNDEARAALRRVQHIYLGGEALPGTLVREIETLSNGSVINMYGPTETTIWSSTEPANASETTINIGMPLANQQLYVLDDNMQPCPIGMPGELWIGGDGVTRGYWNRAEMTAERFVPNPFHQGRMYKTGDLVTRRADGKIDFIGRADGQVKLRGHRIELGEIDAAMEAEQQVPQALAMVREDVPGDKRLIGYFRAERPMTENEWRTILGKNLPSHMIPSRFVQVEEFPLTPNMKIDRKALPVPAAPAAAPVKVVATAPTLSPQSSPSADPDLSKAIAEVWQEVLGVAPTSGQDNFFELGGHSLLAVQAHRTMRERFGAQRLAITDVFRFPTLDAISARVAELSGRPAKTEAKPVQPEASNTRGLSRSEAMSRRKAMRARRSA